MYLCCGESKGKQSGCEALERTISNHSNQHLTWGHLQIPDGPESEGQAEWRPSRRSRGYPWKSEPSPKNDFVSGLTRKDIPWKKRVFACVGLDSRWGNKRGLTSLQHFSPSVYSPTLGSQSPVICMAKKGPSCILSRGTYFKCRSQGMPKY